MKDDLLPPANTMPRTVGFQLEIKGYEVSSWCPLTCGQGPTTQVHLALDIPQLPLPLVLRIKSRRAINTLIAALERHRDDVWGREQ